MWSTKYRLESIKRQVRLTGTILEELLSHGIVGPFANSAEYLTARGYDVPVELCYYNERTADAIRTEIVEWLQSLGYEVSGGSSNYKRSGDRRCWTDVIEVRSPPRGRAKRYMALSTAVRNELMIRDNNLPTPA